MFVISLLFLGLIEVAFLRLGFNWRYAMMLLFATLIGADLTNLGSIAKLGVPVASIGGVGTFDGVFLAGVVAVLLSQVVF